MWCMVLAGDTCARAAATARGAYIADDVAASLKSAHGFSPDPLFEMTTTATPPVTCYIIRMYIGYLVHSRYSILSWELTVCVLLAP